MLLSAGRPGPTRAGPGAPPTVPASNPTPRPNPRPDPYHRWLAIPPGPRPPDHYRLLGVDRDERDPDIISAAMERQAGYVRHFRQGPDGEHATRIIGELVEASRTLASPKRRAEYDSGLGLAGTVGGGLGYRGRRSSATCTTRTGR